MSSLIFTGGRIHAAEQGPGTTPAATAVAVRGDKIIFVGDDEGARRSCPGATEVDLAGRLVTPAFVDAHVHLIQAGLVMNGLDLHGVPSRDRLLARLADFARGHPQAKIIIGQGWDERGWPEAEPPTRAQLDRAAGAVPVYLARVDVHSAVISTALLDQLPGLTELAGYRADGLLSRDAHHRCRGQLDRLFSDDERRAAAAAALRVAAAQGVATLHELGGPHLGPLEDLTRVRQVADQLGLGIVCYWGELASTASIQRARAVGAAGLAGDLCIDGAIGSRTAALRDPYADADGRGARYLSQDEIGDHLVCLHPRRVAGRLPLHRRRRGRGRGGGAAARRPGAPSGADPSRPAPAGTSGDGQRRRPRDAGRTRCGGQRATSVRRRLGSSRRALRATPRPGSGGGDEPVRHPRAARRTAGLRYGRAGHPAHGVGHGPRRRAALARAGADGPGRCVRRGDPRCPLGGVRGSGRTRSPSGGRPTWRSGTSIPTSSIQRPGCRGWLPVRRCPSVRPRSPRDGSFIDQTAFAGSG